MRKFFLLALLALAVGKSGFAQTGDQPLLLRQPTLSKTQVVFSYAGDLWIVDRGGGDARRLTTGVGTEGVPMFSPDGTQIAFSGEYDGNVDVFVVPAAGGVPRRLTYHPGPDVALGWTRDGKQILFRSVRSSYAGFWRLYTMPLEGGFPTEVPLPMAFSGTYSPDGTHLAYDPLGPQQAWKRYHGGATMPIWIANLADSKIEKLPRENSNDFNPMWVGSKIYFLSDRNGPVTLFSYDPATKKVTQLVQNDGLDLKSASAGPGAIVYEQFGVIYLYDLATGKSQKLDIRLTGDLPEVRPRFEKVANQWQMARPSPNGKRAVFEARGEILTVPADKGDVRDLTNTPGVMERDPSWSPDGKWIAYFSDESGEYALHLRDQTGMKPVEKISLGSPPSFFYNPVWSPDSKKIAYSDKRLNLWYLDIKDRKPIKVETDTFAGADFNQAWSPDSKWIAYTKRLKNSMGAIFAYSLDTGKALQITDGMSDARLPNFDKGGKYLYFTASTDIGPAMDSLAGYNRPVTRSVYLVVLRKDLPSPLAPESDDEKVDDADKPSGDKKSDDADKNKDEDKDKAKGEPSKADDKSGDKGKDSASDAAKDGDKKSDDKDKDKKDDKKPAETKIDLGNIGQRIISLPIPARNYSGLAAGKEGFFFIVEGTTASKFDLKKRKLDKALDGVTWFIISDNGEKILYSQGDRWAITSADAPNLTEGTLKTGDMEVKVDPRAEWKQMYREAWRIERDFFYDPGLHGLDLAATEKKYSTWLDTLSTRSDLTYLFTEMLGEITVGHMFIYGGETPEVKHTRGGLLGADYKVENGRYRFAKIYNGENWNPGLRAPLTEPGVNVSEGDYLLAVNGHEVKSADNLYSFFEETAEKQIVLKVGPNPDGSGSREVTVVPVADEGQLRHLAWIEGNRRKVDQLSGGKVAYIYLPNTGGDGYTSFNRYFFPQARKDGAVFDERFNGGGALADYVIDYLRRVPLNLIMTREGEDQIVPNGAIYGPKVMIINETAGSGGDAMPWYFRKTGIGPLVGKRTWGGLIGIGGYPPLMDGGMVTAPRLAIYGLKGDWEVENRGIAPDIEVDLDPAAWRAGHDPQLEKAVQVVMDDLKKNPPPTYQRPVYPNYHKADSRTARANPEASSAKP